MWLFSVINSFSESEKWFYGFCALTVITWGGQRLNHGLATHRERRSRRAIAAIAFRAAIDPEFIGDLRGHTLVTSLLGATAGSLVGNFKVEGLYFKHGRAVKEFRLYLDLIDRYRLDRAWKAYHGGNEEYPNFLVLYGIPQNGPKRLKKHIETLRNVGNHA